jgi:gliding motility-associated-like protein
MRKLYTYLILAFIFIAQNVKADHFVGYDMCLINIKNPNGTPTDNYKFRVRVFRDVLGIPIPTNLQFNLYKNGNATPLSSFNTPKINPQTFLTYPPEECPPDQAQLRVELGIYESPEINYANLTDPAGYYVRASSCCRNIGIINVEGVSSSYGVTFFMDFPRLGTGTPTRYNSSPEYKKNPLTFFCVGKPYTLDWNVVDPDGDSLVYSLEVPLDDGITKPFPLIPYAAGYNLYYNIIDGVPDLTINPKTGIINFIPTRSGKYLVAFKVEEYRKIAGVPTKIGEIRREYQLETVLCPEAPPVTENQNNQKKIIVDTIDYPNDFTMTFTSRDSPTDSLFMYLLPDITPGENLLDPSSLDGKWGEIGSPVGGSTAQNLIIENVGQVVGEFKWSPRCVHVRPKPYKFTIVVRDKTCPSPFYDSTFVTLYVQKRDNNVPMFTNKYLSQADTIKHTSPSTKKLKRYYVKAGDTFQLAADSMIKTWDKDSSQIVNITAEYDPGNGNANNQFIFSANNQVIHSTATFKWTTKCEDNRELPYKIRFYAFDNDCKKPDSVYFDVEIYIRDQPNKKVEISAKTPNIVRIPEGKTDSFFVYLYDSLNASLNKYKNITLMPDFSDFAAVPGGATVGYTSLTGTDSLKVKFTWTPTCANVRPEPYRLMLRTFDEGCPLINNYDTVYVYADGPFNSAPEFRTPDNITFNVVDTTIYGGDLFQYSVFAVDTNTRFDSVYLSLDYTTDITNPSVVSTIAYLVPASGKDSARANLIWQSTCSDIRSASYTARVIARDNECVNPEVAQLIFNITVLEKPNRVPNFTFSNTSLTVDTIYAGETYNVLLTAMDTSDVEFITVDTVFTTVPYSLPKPVINRAFGLGKDTVKTNLTWFADCSLISNTPYIIKTGAWDAACRNPKDSARHVFQLYILPNPLLQPSFTSGGDTIVELVAGETFTLDLNSTSIIPNDSVQILSTGDVYGGIPGNFASFQNFSPGNAQFKWVTSCDQIRDSAYTVFFTTSNPPCKTNEEGYRIKFKVIPNTDVINPIPNVFSPNEDGKNDVYKIIDQYKVYCDPGFRFTIYNRYGKILFESTNPEFEWKADGLGSGTYFYTLESRARSQSGTIDIIK